MQSFQTDWKDRDRKSQKPHAQFPDRLEARDRKSQKTYAEFPDRLERSWNGEGTYVQSVFLGLKLGFPWNR